MAAGIYPNDLKPLIVADTSNTIWRDRAQADCSVSTGHECVAESLTRYLKMREERGLAIHHITQVSYGALRLYPSKTSKKLQFIHNQSAGFLAVTTW